MIDIIIETFIAQVPSQQDIYNICYIACRSEVEDVKLLKTDKRILLLLDENKKSNTKIILM